MHDSKSPVIKLNECDQVMIWHFYNLESSNFSSYEKETIKNQNVDPFWKMLVFVFQKNR